MSKLDQISYTPHIQSFVAFLSQNSITVITGAPDSGKTTLAHQLFGVLSDQLLNGSGVTKFRESEKWILSSIKEFKRDLEKELEVSKGCLQAIEEFGVGSERLIPLHISATVLAGCFVANKISLRFSF